MFMLDIQSDPFAMLFGCRRGAPGGPRPDRRLDLRQTADELWVMTCDHKEKSLLAGAPVFIIARRGVQPLAEGRQLEEWLQALQGCTDGLDVQMRAATGSEQVTVHLSAEECRRAERFCRRHLRYFETSLRDSKRA